MLAHPDLKNVIIDTIVFNDQPSNLILLDVEVNRLMKAVTFLSNKPFLMLQTASSEGFKTPEGATFLRCLSNIHFSSVISLQCLPVYNQLFGNQFSRRNPTRFLLKTVDQNRKFFEKNLKNGKIKYFDEEEDSGHRFPAEVMEGIISSFLKSPENYRDAFISAHFDVGSTEALLEQKLKGGNCVKEANGSYCFTVYNSKLQRRLEIVETTGESLYVCKTH